MQTSRNRTLVTPSYAFTARPVLDQLEAELRPEQLVAARNAAGAATLEELVRTAGHGKDGVDASG